jgi:hypothetical protein
MNKETLEQRRLRWKKTLENTKFPVGIDVVVKQAIQSHKGDYTILESAIGSLFLGFAIGWRPLVIIHSPRTIKRYEQILGVKFKEFLPEITDMSDRSKGYQMALRLDDFWRGVTGNETVENRKIDLGLDGQMD